MCTAFCLDTLYWQTKISAATTFRASYPERTARTSLASHQALWRPTGTILFAGSRPWGSKRRHIRRLSGGLVVTCTCFHFRLVVHGVFRSRLRTYTVDSVYLFICRLQGLLSYSMVIPNDNAVLRLLCLTFAEDERAFDRGYSCYSPPPKTAHRTRVGETPDPRETT